MNALRPSREPHRPTPHTMPDLPSSPPLLGWVSSPERRDVLSGIARHSLFRRIGMRSFQTWCDLHHALMTRTSHQPHPLARSQALDTWAVARERAIAKLVHETEALEEHNLTKDAAYLAISRLRESVCRERAEAAALRATWDRCRKSERTWEWS